MKFQSILMLFALFSITLVPVVSAHQIDSVGEYRVQIGWTQEPAVSGEPNGIELYVSPLDLELPPEEQEFKDGIPGLEKNLKIQVVFKDEKTTLPLRADHNIPGKYFALIEPTIPGFYQVNILGNIGETNVSKSLHAPKVENESHIQFPQPPDDVIIQEHENFKDEITQIQNSIESLESSQNNLDITYIAIGISIIAIVIAIISVVKRR